MDTSLAQTNTQISYQQSLIQAGLNSEQALIYEVLLRNGPLPAGRIHQKTPLKRGLVYKRLDELVAVGLVAKKDQPGKVAIFEPAHPLKLKELAEQKEEQAKTAQTALSGVMNQLTSEYNLAVGKPGVRFYEGLEGIKTVTFDNLTAKTPILAYLDMATIFQHLKPMNDEYVKIRRRLKLKKLNLVNDTLENKQYLATYNRDITDIRLMSQQEAPMHFACMMQIYDNKVSYVTIDPDRWIGVIIEDKNIADMHRQLYMYSWQIAQPLNVITPPFSAVGI